MARVHSTSAYRFGCMRAKQADMQQYAPRPNCVHACM